MLLLVWKGGAKQRDHGKPSAHWALLPEASVSKMFIIFYYHIRQDAMPCPRVSTYTLPQRQPAWRSGVVSLKATRPAYWWLHSMLLVTSPLVQL